VPDGYNPDPKYIDDVSPTGKIGSFHGHKTLWNYQSLGQLLNNTGWHTNIIEYYNEEGNFISNNFTSDNGEIKRSSKNKSVNGELSLIIDCIKK
jgi:predicted SAM-dependent methyltransferase